MKDLETWHRANADARRAARARESWEDRDTHIPTRQHTPTHFTLHMVCQKQNMFVHN